MFDIGLSEILIVAIVALIVLGPERLPKAARLTGFWVRKARAQWYTVKAELESEMAADEELKNSLKESMTELQQALNSQQESLQQEMQAVDTELQQSFQVQQKSLQHEMQLLDANLSQENKSGSQADTPPDTESTHKP